MQTFATVQDTGRNVTMEGHFTEFALNQAAMEPDCPLLARPLYLYRDTNELSVESLASWLGLGEVDELNRLAMCLAPRPGSSWNEAFAELMAQFPTLRAVRLQLVIASVCPTQQLIA